MAMLTIRNLPDEVHRALRLLAAHHGRSTEAEVRAILEEAVKPPGRLKLGSRLLQIGQQIQLSDEEIEQINQRDRSPVQPISFE